MTGREVVELIKKKRRSPVERAVRPRYIQARQSGLPVKGIATTDDGDLRHAQARQSAGLNMVISHEDTLWNDRDDTKDLDSESAVQVEGGIRAEERHDRLAHHDHMHAMRPDYTVVGSFVLSASKAARTPMMHPRIFTIPETTLGEFASQVKRRPALAHSVASAIQRQGQQDSGRTRICDAAHDTRSRCSDRRRTAGSRRRLRQRGIRARCLVRSACRKGSSCWDMSFRNRAGWRIWRNGLGRLLKAYRFSSCLPMSRSGLRNR